MAGTSAVTNTTATIPDPTAALGAVSGGASSISRASDNAKATEQQFLNLLVTQLRYQDPLNPMQGTEFTSQLAQFSSLEQLININKSLQNLGGLQNAFAQAQAIGMLGKQVLAEGNTITVADGVSSNIAFSLEQSSDDTLVNVFGPDGNLIGVFDAGARGTGLQTVAFPAKDQQGNTLQDGVYTFSVLAFSPDGKSISSQTFSSGIVQGVKFAQDGTLLTMGSKDIPLSGVIQITEPKPTTSGGTTTGGGTPAN